MLPDNSWTGETHYFLYPSSVNNIVAVHRAAIAAGLVITKSAFFQTIVGVFHKIPAIGAQIGCRTVMCATVHPDHDVFSADFPGDIVLHWEK